MYSTTKSKLSNNQINKIIEIAFINKTYALKFEELPDGFFNTLYKIQLDNNSTVVLKVAPKTEVKVLTYEKNLMNNEVLTYEIFKKNNIPVPTLLFYDNSFTLLDREYFFMSYIDGIPLNKIKNKLSSKQLKLIYIQLGKYMHLLSNIDNLFFGELANKGKQFDNWYICFSNMLFDLFNDAKSINLNLDININDVDKLLKKFKHIFEKVKKPHLVHKDLWDGNILLNKKTYNISAIIDCERAIYADSLMEIACAHYDNNNEFINEYYSHSKFSYEEKIKLTFYKFYLYLLMIIECPYRKYENNDQFIWAKEKLNEMYYSLISNIT